MSREMAKVWERVENKTERFPNGQIAKEVFENIAIGGYIIRRYNEIGDIVYTNEEDWKGYGWHTVLDAIA